MAKTKQLARAPRFGDTSFALTGSPQANFGPASWGRQPMTAQAPQAAMPGATGTEQFVAPDQAAYYLSRLDELVGTPKRDFPKAMAGFRKDYSQLVAQLHGQFWKQKQHALDQLKHQQTLGAAAEDKRQFGVTERRLAGQAAETATKNKAARKLARDKFDRAGNIPFLQDSAEATRDPNTRAQAAAEVRDFLMQQGMPRDEATKQGWMAVSMQGAGGGAIEQKPMTDAVLQKLEAMGYTGAEKGLTPDQTRRQRLQGLAGDLLSERVEKGLAKIRRPAAAKRAPSQDQGAWPEIDALRRAKPQRPAAAKQPELPLRGHPATQPKQPQAKAPAADRKWGPGTGRRLVLVPGFPEPQTIPDNQLHDFLDSVPGAKLLE